MTRLYLMLGTGAAGLALIAALFFLISANADKASRIKALNDQLATAEARVEFVERQWAESAQREGVTQAEAARICAAEGSSAFDRGVAFGRASCGL